MKTCRVMDSSVEAKDEMKFFLYKLPVVMGFIPAIGTLSQGLGHRGHSAGARGGSHLEQSYSKDLANPPFNTNSQLCLEPDTMRSE